MYQKLLNVRLTAPIYRAFTILAVCLFGVAVMSGAAHAAPVRGFDIIDVRLGMTLEQVTAKLAARGFTYEPMVHGIWPNRVANRYSYSHRRCISEWNDTLVTRDHGSCIDQLEGVGTTPDTSVQILFVENPDRHRSSIVFSVTVINALHSRGPLERETLRNAIFKKFGPATEESSPVDDQLSDSKVYYWCTRLHCHTPEDHVRVISPSLVLNMGLTEAFLQLSDQSLKDRPDADFQHAQDLKALKQNKPNF